MKLCFVFMLSALCAFAQSVTPNRRLNFQPVATSGFTNTTAGLIAWYKFDDGSGTTATDSSGSGFNGTLSGAAIPTWTTGQIGTGALSFNGTNSWVALGTQVKAALSYTNTGGFTITLWIKPTMLRGSSTYQNPFASGNVSTTDRMAIQITPSSNDIRFTMNNGSNIAKSITGFTYTNIWVFCSMTWSNATTVGGYTNSVAVAGTTAGSLDNTSDTKIGTSTIATSGPFKGDIDDVRIYNRVLSSGEITNIFQWRP